MKVVKRLASSKKFIVVLAISFVIIISMTLYGFNDDETNNDNGSPQLHIDNLKIIRQDSSNMMVDSNGIYVYR